MRWNDGNKRIEHTSASMRVSHHQSAAVAVPTTKARIKACAMPYTLP